MRLQGFRVVSYRLILDWGGGGMVDWGGGGSGDGVGGGGGGGGAVVRFDTAASCW